MITVGEALVQQLEARGVEVVFGIPGVHTIELYRGLAASGIRHITPRHEQGAGFMADGYARVSGKPGVAFVITGPGLTNTLTPMAQARADSVPMLVVSGVNRRDTLGKGLGLLHELPDQQSLTAKVALASEQIDQPEALFPALDRAFTVMTYGRPGPVHIEIPTDVMPLSSASNSADRSPAGNQSPDIGPALKRLRTAKRPVIIAGGGARNCDTALTVLAEALDAPVIQTANARGLMHGHALCVPASPSLKAVRALIESADLVLALGTELGPTDYDMYALGGLPDFPPMIRVDVCADQLALYPADISVHGRTEAVVPALTEALATHSGFAEGHERASGGREAARAELSVLGADYPRLVDLLECLRDRLPGACLIGDSTQITYAGNLCYDHDRPGGWFNGATGFGALGYAIPAAIGASIADPGAPVVAIMGDGGAQFTLPEIMVAVEEKLPILFVIWNNAAYAEIGNAMAAVGIEVVGCDPAPPDFAHIATACGISHTRASPTREGLTSALDALLPLDGPAMLEIDARK